MNTSSAQNRATVPPGPSFVPAQLRGPLSAWHLLLVIPLLWGFDLALGISLAVLNEVTSQNLTESPVATLALGLISGGFAVTALYVVVCWFRGQSFREGFAFQTPSLRQVALALGVSVCGAATGTVLLHYFSTGESAMAKLASTPEGLACVSVLAILIPVVEELYYRGFLYPVFERHLGKIAGAALVAFWFGAVHVPQLIGDWIAIPVVAMMGLFWTIMRAKTGSLTLSLLSHITYNGLLVLISILTWESPT